MGWVEARDRIIAIVEGSTVTTKKRGSGDRFNYAKAAARDLVPDSRGFWFDTPERASMHGQVTAVLPNRTHVTVPLLIAYRLDLAPADRLEVMLKDYDVLVRRLMDAALWSASTSTIENLSANEDDLLAAQFEGVNGAVLMKLILKIEFRTT